MTASRNGQPHGRRVRGPGGFWAYVPAPADRLMECLGAWETFLRVDVSRPTSPA
jgi:hypothetical protein